MGKCESAEASIGIKILLSDIVLQINEKNFRLIMEMLRKGFIEDDNDYFNDVYTDIIHDGPMNSNDFEVVKKYLMDNFKNRGSITINKYGYIENPALSNGCLFDKYLLVPIKKILNTDRYGYDRCGINGSSRLIDFDLSLNIQKYKKIDKFEMVFLLRQHSG